MTAGHESPQKKQGEKSEYDYPYVFFYSVLLFCFYVFPYVFIFSIFYMPFNIMD